MPESKDVGTNIKNLRKAHPEWSHDKVLAVALEEAREMGAPIPRRKEKK